ncbi:unnamed protein product [Gordionus sp. m RMFG-2023]
MTYLKEPFWGYNRSRTWSIGRKKTTGQTEYSNLYKLLKILKISKKIMKNARDTLFSLSRTCENIAIEQKFYFTKNHDNADLALDDRTYLILNDRIHFALNDKADLILNDKADLILNNNADLALNGKTSDS